MSDISLISDAIATVTADEVALDAKRYRFLISNHQLSTRWRVKKGIQQWQLVEDGEPFGRWHNSHRACLDEAIKLKKWEG